MYLQNPGMLVGRGSLQFHTDGAISLDNSGLCNYFVAFGGGLGVLKLLLPK